MKKRILIICACLFSLLIVIIVVCNVMVLRSCDGRDYNKVEEIPHNTYGILLGTSPITRVGGHNLYFDERIKAASKLYNEGKVDTIIASGGDYEGKQKYGCNELTAMRDSLIGRGVPADRIKLDYDGTRTIKSIDNAINKYGIKKATLISQGYHNSRALYQADRLGLDAIAFNAEEPNLRFHIIKNHLREYLARVKVVWEMMRY